MREALAQVVVRADGEHSAVHRARPAGPLRLFCPRRPGAAAWVVASNLGGGLVDGDDLALEIAVERGATCVVTTQASTKVYRGGTRQRTRIRVDAGAAAIVAPDPVVPFRGARFAQATTVELAADASLVLADTITAGRVAHGERWAAARIDSALEVAIAGTRRLIDRVVLEGRGEGDSASCGDGELASRGPGDVTRSVTGELARRMRRFEALATCVLVGPRVAEHAAAALAHRTRPAPGAALVIAGSPLGDGAVFRIAGERVEPVTLAVRALLGPACAALGALPWQRRW